MFDVEKMTRFAVSAIRDFADRHPDETFYAFMVDANMLCLNSEEQFRKTLSWYQEKYPESYASDESIRELKANTGDWKYQGFAELDEATGFDDELYDEHYESAGSSEDGRAPDSSYAQAMTALLAELTRSNAFATLKISTDFVASWVEHNY